MKNIILSVLFWAVASVCAAITLPKSSYDMDMNPTSSESYTSNIGTQFMNRAVLTAYKGECDHLRPDENAGLDGDIEACKQCCRDNVERGDSRQECMLNCSIPLGMPLGTPLLLLPFALVYAIVRRKRKEETL